MTGLVAGGVSALCVFSRSDNHPHMYQPTYLPCVPHDEMHDPRLRLLLLLLLRLREPRRGQDRREGGRLERGAEPVVWARQGEDQRLPAHEPGADVVTLYNICGEDV